jgi:hypothetical protein
MSFTAALIMNNTVTVKMALKQAAFSWTPHLREFSEKERDPALEERDPVRQSDRHCRIILSIIGSR